MCHGRTLSLRKPILSMFSTLGTPSAMLRSPSESPIRMMLQYSFSCLKYSVFRRAPSCLLYTWISSPLKPFRTPCEMRSRSDQRGESRYHNVFLQSLDWAVTQAEGQKLCRTHVVVEVHEVGDDLDVGVVDSGLADDFLQDVAQAGGEDEDRHIVLLQAVEELLKAFPDTQQTWRETRWWLTALYIIHLHIFIF